MSLLALLTVANASQMPEDYAFTPRAPSIAEYPMNAERTPRRKSPLLAAGLNWFLPGTGYIYNGERPVLGATLAVGAVGLTVVEQSHAIFGDGLKTHNPELFNLMFASVLIMNTGLAVDAFVEARSINDNNGHERKRQVSLAPAILPGHDDETAYGLVVSLR